MPDPPVGLSKAMDAEDWKLLRSRGMRWRLTAECNVRIEDPTTRRVASAATLKLAFDKLTNP